MELRVCLTCEKAVVEGSRCPECGGAVTLADPAVFVGETFGKYHIDRLIGVGGMGAVFQATHRTLRRPVAVKIVLPQKDDDAFRRRFLREARVLAEVHHPHVVEVYDFDVNDWGISYLVMEFLEGGSLKTRLQEQPRLGWAELGPVIRGVAEGLASAHAAGIVHRDLKPDNIFLATYGDRQVAKVIDFGIAKATTGEHHETQLTRSGYVVGTLAYLAPEQLLGSEVGPATDQYALALVVAEALTGRAVRADKTMGQIISTDIVQPVELPPTVAIGLPEGALAVIRRATAPVPNDRFESVQVFASALDDVLAGHTAPSPSSDLDRPTVLSGERPPAIATATATSVTRSPRPGNGRFVALAGGVLAIVAVVFGLVWTTDSGPQHAAPAAAQGPLSVEATIPLPVDAGRLITYRTDLLVAAGADGLLAARPAQGGWTTDRIGLDPDDVLGFTPDNELIRRDEGRLLIHAVAKGAAMPLAERLPEDADLVMAPDSRHVVATRQEGLVIHQLVDGRFERLRTHPLPTPPQAVAIGTRFLVAVTSDVIVWRLEDGAEMLRTPFPDATVVAIAIHDVAGLVAMGGWSDRVLVWDLASGAMTAIPRRFGADRSLDLEFLFHGPTLAVGERGGVTLWTPTDGAVQAWNDARCRRQRPSGRIRATPGPGPGRRAGGRSSPLRNHRRRNRRRQRRGPLGDDRESRYRVGAHRRIRRHSPRCRPGNPGILGPFSPPAGHHLARERRPTAGHCVGRQDHRRLASARDDGGVAQPSPRLPGQPAPTGRRRTEPVVHQFRRAAQALGLARSGGTGDHRHRGPLRTEVRSSRHLDGRRPEPCSAGHLESSRGRAVAE
jgi:serine/threonine protein kinase